MSRVWHPWNRIRWRESFGAWKPWVWVWTLIGLPVSLGSLRVLLRQRLNMIMFVNAEAEAPVLWVPDVKSWLIGKEPDAGKDWGQEEKRATEDEMVRWHHWLNGHESEQTLGDSEGLGSLACYSSWGPKESDRLSNWTTTKLFVKSLAGSRISESVGWRNNVGLRKSNYGFSVFLLQEAFLDCCSPPLVVSHWCFWWRFTFICFCHMLTLVWEWIHFMVQEPGLRGKAGSKSSKPPCAVECLTAGFLGVGRTLDCSPCRLLRCTYFLTMVVSKLLMASQPAFNLFEDLIMGTSVSWIQQTTEKTLVHRELADQDRRRVPGIHMVNSNNSQQ